MDRLAPDKERARVAGVSRGATRGNAQRQMSSWSKIELKCAKISAEMTNGRTSIRQQAVVAIAIGSGINLIDRLVSGCSARACCVVICT